MTNDATTADANVSSATELKCPCCSGNELRFGRGGVFKVPFVPETPMLQFAKSYLPRQFVCLGCGFLGFALKQSDLGRLQKDMRSRANSVE
jgi:hypothetical protein